MVSRHLAWGPGVLRRGRCRDAATGPGLGDEALAVEQPDHHQGLNGNVRGLARAAGTDRDDDRFWKAGLLYVNHDDPAIVVGARFGVGWMLNFGNPVAWLLLAGFVAWWAGLAALGAAAGM
jgi:hypothetical protein